MHLLDMPGFKEAQAEIVKGILLRRGKVQHLLHAHVVHKLVGLIHYFLLQQLLQHILYGDDPHGLIVVYAICPR